MKNPAKPVAPEIVRVILFFLITLFYNLHKNIVQVSGVSPTALCDLIGNRIKFNDQWVSNLCDRIINYIKALLFFGLNTLFIKVTKGALLF